MSELVRVCFCHWTCPCLPVLIIYGMWIYCERELDRIDIICAQYSIPYSCAVSQSLTIVWVYLCWYLGAQVFAVISNLFVSVILYLTCAKERIIKRFQILPGYVAYGITANASLWSLLVYNGCTEFGISNCDSTLLNMHWQHLFVISYSFTPHAICPFLFEPCWPDYQLLFFGHCRGIFYTDICIQLMVTLFMAYSYHFSLTIIIWIDVGCWKDFSKN